MVGSGLHNREHPDMLSRHEFAASGGDDDEDFKIGEITSNDDYNIDGFVVSIG